MQGGQNLGDARGRARERADERGGSWRRRPPDQSTPAACSHPGMRACARRRPARRASAGAPPGRCCTADWPLLPPAEPLRPLAPPEPMRRRGARVPPPRAPRRASAGPRQESSLPPACHPVRSGLPINHGADGPDRFKLCLYMQHSIVYATANVLLAIARSSCTRGGAFCVASSTVLGSEGPFCQASACARRRLSAPRLAHRSPRRPAPAGSCARPRTCLLHPRPAAQTLT
jgi:hypothetical protein